ncbi:MAG: YIP1 family protein [Acidobacteriota bacterium]
MPQDQVAAIQPDAGSMSALSRVGNVIIEPTRTFADIAVRPGWWVPMILVAAFSLLYMIAFSQRVGWERMFRHAMETSADQRVQNLTPEQREQTIQMQVKFGGPIGTVMAVVMTPVVMIVVAGVFMFVFGTMLGGAVKFKQALGVVAHAWIPQLIAVCAYLLVMFLKSPDDFDLANPAGFNLGFYLNPQTTPKWFVSLGNSIDVFVFWTLLLLATGFSVTAKKSWVSSLVGVLFTWAVFVAIKVGWAAIFG